MEINTALSKRDIKTKQDIYKETNILKDINKIKQPVEVKLKHYVLEFWRNDPKDLKKIETWKMNMPVKDKNTYQVMDCIFAFQFYDLVNICVNGEYIEGKRKYNVSPLIYMGERKYINEDESIIIDRDGGIHSGESGITYDEYLNLINKNQKKVVHRKFKKF